MISCYEGLVGQAKVFNHSSLHLKVLLEQTNRFPEFSLKTDGFFFDFTRQRIDKSGLVLLQELAKTTRACERFQQMAQGDVVNDTENRAALHMAARGSGSGPIQLGQMDVRSEIVRVKSEIQTFTKAVHDGQITGCHDKPFTHAVVVGIGGSYLGCQFIHKAMTQTMDEKICLYFLPNVDIDNFASVAKIIKPETTLWIVISKSYTTTETLANLNQVSSFLHEQNLLPQEHLVTITAKSSPGDDPDKPVLASFHMFDFIGGRFSVSSAVGGLPLSLAFGDHAFEEFLQGCQAMDNHALTAKEESNIPLTAALISIWNTIILNYPAQAIIPYASSLSKLAPHVQQLHMESIGKSVTSDGLPLTRPAGAIVFGEPGTNAQHSFFQLAHQGIGFPIDFIGVVKPGYKGGQAISNGVTNHQELWANLLAQAKALATGQAHEDPARMFEGNRPSSIILLNDLTPKSLGFLLSFYEAKTVFEGFILGINPFDQFGVELGKKMAKDIRDEIAALSKKATQEFSHLDEATQFYLKTLFNEGMD